MVKPGYKQTEIGVIPEDWDSVQLGEKVKIYRGGSPRPIQDYITTSSNGVNWIKIGDVRKNDKYIRSTQEKIIPEGITKSREVHTGDFILSNSMSFGRPYILDIDGCIHDGWLTIQDYQNTFSTEYLYYLLSSDLVYKQYIGMAAGSSVKNLNKDKVFALYVIYPDVPEQERIAEALSDVDELISSLEKLIAKYKSIKSACLQQMFPQKGEKVPRMRLPGFTDAWEQRKVSDLAEKTYGGGTPTTSNEAYWNGDIPWIQSSDVVDGKLLGVEPRKWITQDGLNNSAAQLIPGNSIAIITRVGVGKLAFMPYSYATSQDFLSLSKLNAEPLFTVYACYKKLQSELNAVQGTSIKGITKDELLAKNIMVPRYAEQQQIGAFFKQLDHLITLHQRKLRKVKKIKEGMMQQLLTGNIRLV